MVEGGKEGKIEIYMERRKEKNMEGRKMRKRKETEVLGIEEDFRHARRIEK